VTSVRDVVGHGTGQALDAGVRTDMEAGLGADLSRVRVHTGAAAARSALAIGARAYTAGDDIVFGPGAYAPATAEGRHTLAHELAHVQQQREGPVSGTNVGNGVTISDPSDSFEQEADAIARRVSSQTQPRGGAGTSCGAPGAPGRQFAVQRAGMGDVKVAEAHESEAGSSESTQSPPGSDQEAAYPADASRLAAFLLRSGYVEEVANLIGPNWRSMSEAELTEYLSKNFTEKELEEKFLATYAERTAIKAKYRGGNVIAAFVVGLIWARSNFAEGQWKEGIAKVTETTVASWLINRMLYARDPAAEAIMARAPLEFGRWFQGAARTNKFVNFLARDVARGLLIWDLKDFLMSGGGGGPNIPGDIIYVIDIDDPSTWEEPSQILLDLGFDIWYRQKEKPTRPATNMYLGKVEGSRLKGLSHLAYALANAAMPFNQDMVEKMVREGAARDYEHFKQQNPDATPADYARMQQALEDFDTWGLP
jgi:hypothetical protein